MSDDAIDEIERDVAGDDEREPTQLAAPRSRRPPLWLLAVGGVIAGVLLGLGAAALVARNDGGDGDAMELAPVLSPYPEDQAAHAEAFLEAWARHRMATYRAEMTWTRRLTSGQQLQVTRTVLQQPPQRAVRQAGSTTVVAADASLSCEPRADGAVCTQLPGVDYEREVATELAAWQTAIAGERPVYAIEATSGSCFELRLVRVVPEPPYGDLSRVCFDEGTGALRSREVVRATATETEEATSLTGTVTEADWQEIRG